MDVNITNNLKESGKVMAFQVFMTSLFVIIMVIGIHHIIMTHMHSRPELLWCTFLFAFILDQVKTFVWLTTVWYVLIKRCGYLAQNEIDYQVVEDPVSLKQETFLPGLKVSCMKLLESSNFENGSFAFVGVYTLFTLYWLAIQDMLGLISTDTLPLIDIIFTTLFLIEI